MFIREVLLVLMLQYLPLVTHAAIDAIIYTEWQLLTVSGGWPIESLQPHSLTTGVMYVCIKSAAPHTLRSHSKLPQLTRGK
jgi:hypothetical protein